MKTTPKNRPAVRRRPAAPSGLTLARAIVKYFGTGPIDPFLETDIKLRDMALAIVKKARA